MRSNYYDFGAMEVNPPEHRRTPNGWSGSRLRAPKRGDKKNWRKLLIYCFAFFHGMEDMVHLKPLYNITDLDIKKERVSTKNRVVINKAEAKRKQKETPVPLTEALRELEVIKRLPFEIKYLEGRSEKKARSAKHLLERLTDPRKVKRRNKIIEEFKNPRPYDLFLFRMLQKSNLV